MNVITFEDEIILYWDKKWDADGDISYRILLDGETAGVTNKTHFTVNGIEAEREYNVSVELTDIDKNESEIIYSGTLSASKAKKRIDITKAPYFAAGDGIKINTAAIQAALNDCTPDDCVYIPEGTFLTGALDVHSDTEIYIEKDAVLQGTSYAEDYLPKIKSRFEGTEMMCYRSLLNLGKLDRNRIYNCKNVIIRGKGSILGGGVELAADITEREREELKDFLEANKDYVATCENENTIPARARGRLICMNNCDNVILSGLTVGYGASWNIHMIYSKNIVTCGCFITSEGVWNGDGWDPDSSENCTLFNTVMKTHDDGIAIKSGKNPEGNIVNRPTRDIRIFDCRGKNGVAVGSEISGGVDGVYVWDCVFPESMGMNIKSTVKRGGYIRNVRMKDCECMGIYVRTKLSFNNDGEGAGYLTELCDYSFENITLLADSVRSSTEEIITKRPIYIEGFDGEENYVKNVSLKKIKIKKSDYNNIDTVFIRNAKNISLELI